MTPSILRKLSALAERHEELGLLLAEPSIHDDSQRFLRISREYAQLRSVVEGLNRYRAVEQQWQQAREWVQSGDLELSSMAQEELAELAVERERLDQSLLLELLPNDANDGANLFLEIRAGTGGDEAAIFSGDLFRMYTRYADRRGWRVEVMSANAGEHGGYKEVVVRIEGAGAFERMKFESGTHRVQRVPATEAQGRIHTSACTVAILVEVDAVADIEINPADLKVDTYRASGAGGQHVNKTESAIRIHHLPSGIVVECQDERSQHKNRARAMSLLAARLKDAEVSKQQAQISQSRRLQVGSGDRSQRIRTYNFPQGRLTDHRINLTLYQLEEIMEGALDPVTDALLNEHRADQLKSMLEQDEMRV